MQNLHGAVWIIAAPPAVLRAAVSGPLGITIATMAAMVALGCGLRWP